MALMGVEMLVFGCDEGLLDPVGDRGHRNEDAALAGEFVHQAVVARIDRLIVLGW